MPRDTSDALPPIDQSGSSKELLPLSGPTEPNKGGSKPGA